MIRSCFICFYLFCYIPLLANEKTFPTNFVYSQELQNLKSLQSDVVVTPKELQKWDQIASDAAKDEIPSSFTLLRFYTYLYVAQADAAFLSYNIKGKWMGSLDPVSAGVVALFFPDYKIPDFTNDAYSNSLAKIVLNKIQQRMESEDSQSLKFHVPKEKASIYVVGLNTASWIPWYAKPVSSYWPPAPPSEKAFWDQQIEKIKQMQTPLTKEKKEAIGAWANSPGFNTKDWRLIANDYLFAHNVPLPKIIQARSSLMMGLYDGTIVGFSAKYHYLVQRPQEYDSSVHYEIQVPKHPSYPANHALMASVAATILSAFFPEEAKYWHEMANQSGTSRIWAGIHYPIDIIAGEEVGKKVGERILEATKDSQ